MPKLAVGIILYNSATAKYLPYFLPSIKKQTWQDFIILAADNSEEKNNENLRFLNDNYFPSNKECQSRFEYRWSGGNIGFARAYNILIKQALEKGAQYFFVSNPDIIYNNDVFGQLVKALDSGNDLGSVCPKILQWDFKNKEKTNLVDSCGIQLKPGLKFVDLGQGEKDQGQCAGKEIIGPSGASAIYKMSALEEVKHDGQYFDEMMFMYKEDCDLAYRLHISGYKSRCISQAVAYHDRTAAAGGQGSLQVSVNRRRKGRQVKEWSFLNQLIIFQKFWSSQNFSNKIAVLWYLAQMMIYISFFERYLLKQIKEFIKLRKKIISNEA